MFPMEKICKKYKYLVYRLTQKVFRCITSYGGKSLKRILTYRYEFVNIACKFVNNTCIIISQACLKY